MTMTAAYLRLGIAVLALAPQAVLAANWIVIGNVKDGPVSIDADTVKVSGSNRYGWVRMPEKAPVAYSLIRMKVDCASETSGALSATEYRADGSVIRSMSWKDWEVSMTPNPPGSIGETQARELCSLQN